MPGLWVSVNKKPILGKKRRVPVQGEGKTFKDLAEVQQGETEVWKVPATSTIQFMQVTYFLMTLQNLKARQAQLRYDVLS